MIAAYLLWLGNYNGYGPSSSHKLPPQLVIGKKNHQASWVSAVFALQGLKFQLHLPLRQAKGGPVQ